MKKLIITLLALMAFTAWAETKLENFTPIKIPLSCYQLTQMGVVEVQTPKIETVTFSWGMSFFPNMPRTLSEAKITVKEEPIVTKQKDGTWLITFKKDK